MTGHDPTDHWHRRAFLRSSLAVGAGLLRRPLGAADVAPVTPLPVGVVARYGTPWFRSPVAIEGPIGIESIRFTPDSERLVAVGKDDSALRIVVTVWDANSGRRTAVLNLPVEADGGDFGNLAFCGITFPSKDELLLVTRARSGRLGIDRLNLRLGTVASRAEIRLPADGYCYTSPDGAIVVQQRDKEIVAYSIPAGEELWAVRSDSVRCGYQFDPVFRTDASELVVITRDEFRLVEARTGRVIQAFPRDNNNANFRPRGFGSDGRTVLFEGDGTGVKVLNLRTLGFKKLDGANPFTPVVPIRGGVAAWCGEKVGLWDPVTGEKVRDLALPKALLPWVASPDGRLAARSVASSVEVWDAVKGEPLANSPEPLGEIRNLEYRDAGTLTARLSRFSSAEPASSQRITWNLATGRSVTTNLTGPGNLYDISLDGRTAIAVGPGGTLEVRDNAARAVPKILQLADPITELQGGQFTPDGTRFVAARGFTDRIVIWDVATGTSRSINAAPDSNLMLARSNGIGISPNDRAAVCLVQRPGGDPSLPIRVVVLDLRSGERLGSCNSSGVPVGVVLTPDASRVAVGTCLLTRNPKGGFRDTKSVAVFDAASGSPLCSVTVSTNDNCQFVGIRALALSPDGRTLVTGVGRVATAWEVATGSERARFRHDGEITSTAVSPDGRTVAVASRDAPVWEWEFLGTAGAGPATPAEPDRLWSDLGASNGEAGFRAVRLLCKFPVGGCGLLNERLRPAEAVEPAKIDTLIGLLSDDTFRNREKAQRELQDLDGRGLARLGVARKRITNPEGGRRLDEVIKSGASQTPATAEGLRAVRAVEAAERMAGAGHKPARALIERWAGGEVDGRLTREAVAALRRVRDAAR